jgi:small-conductance mechanosensitive channel
MSFEWYKWLIPVFLCFALYYILVVVKKILLQKISQFEFTNNLVQSITIEVLTKIKNFSLFVFAFFITLLTIELPERFLPFVHKSFKVIVIIHMGQLSVWILKTWLKKQFLNKSTDDASKTTTINLISLISQFVIYSLVFLLILNNLGVDITALVAGLGVGGVAIALAVQNILSDLFSSLTIVLDKPFIVGDVIRVGEFEGTVEKIGLKTTRLKSISGEHLVIGNADLLQSRIRNFKHMDERRVLQNLTVTYQTSPDVLEKIPLWVNEIVSSQQDVRFERCHLLRFADSSLDFELVYWIQDSQYHVYADITQKINISILKKFAHEKVEFAYPTRTIFKHTF